jgi:glutamate-ammonia-ligase adenylyltransferase
VELLAFSEFLADILIRNPEYFDWLIQPEVVNEEYSLERFRELLALSTAAFRRRETLRRAVCRWKRRHLLRIGARDLLGKASIRQAGRELAWMTQAVVDSLSNTPAPNARSATGRRSPNPKAPPAPRPGPPRSPFTAWANLAEKT